MLLLFGEVSHAGRVLYLAAAADAQPPLKDIAHGLFEQPAAAGHRVAQGVSGSSVQRHRVLLQHDLLALGEDLQQILPEPLGRRLHGLFRIQHPTVEVRGEPHMLDVVLLIGRRQLQKPG